MSDTTIGTFFAEGTVRGATVLVLGRVGAAAIGPVVSAVGPAGLVVVIAHENGHRDVAGAAAVCAEYAALPIASHVVDRAAALLGDVDMRDFPVIAEELRRVLAPGGDARLVLPAGHTRTALAFLRTAGLRSLHGSAHGALTLLRGRGP